MVKNDVPNNQTDLPTIEELEEAGEIEQLFNDDDLSSEDSDSIEDLTSEPSETIIQAPVNSAVQSEIYLSPADVMSKMCYIHYGSLYESIVYIVSLPSEENDIIDISSLFEDTD